MRHRSGPAVSRGGDIDDPRIDLGNSFVAQPQTLDRAGAHVLDEDVAALDDLKREGAIGFFLEVELDIALVLIGGDMQDRRAVNPWWNASGEIVAAGPFHPDNVGAHGAQ